MKIIIRGKVPEPQPIRHTCSYCGTIFEFEETEIFGGCVDCPVCHKHIRIHPTVPYPKYPKPYTPYVPWQKYK